MSLTNLDLDLAALLPAQSRLVGASRRTALKLALGVGYAASAGPLMAQTAVRTASEGLATGETSYEVAGFKVPVFFAAPAGKTNLPVVLVIHEAFGVHEYIADICRRFARAGYLALAPELFARQGEPSDYGEMAKLFAEVISKVSDAQVLADLDGAASWAGSHGGDLARLGVTGFCMGGRWTWLYAAHAPVRAAVAWYGRLVGEKNAMQPLHPLDLAATMRAPVLGLYGGKDSGIPLESVAAMKAALLAGSPLSKAAELVVYPETGHAFHADYRASYSQGPAEDGWQRCLAWLKTHGVA